MLTKIRYKLVYNRSHRLNRFGEGLVEIECSQSGRRIYFTTHTYVIPGQFCRGAIVNARTPKG